MFLSTLVDGVHLSNDHGIEKMSLSTLANGVHSLTLFWAVQICRMPTETINSHNTNKNHGCVELNHGMTMFHPRNCLHDSAPARPQRERQTPTRNNARGGVLGRFNLTFMAPATNIECPVAVLAERNIVNLHAKQAAHLNFPCTDT